MKPKARAWQVPISLQGNSVETRAHFFSAHRQKHRLTSAACGRRFSPGFAVPAKRGMYRCSVCRAAIRKTG